MDLYTAVRTRYSARKFTSRPIAEETLRRMLDAARLAPSARNGQEWRFVIVRDAARRGALQEASFGQRQVGAAPIVIAACAETDGRVMSCGQPAYPIDVAIAVDHLTLAATAEGLGSCWICRFDEARAKRALAIPDVPTIRVVALLPIGYPADSAPARKQRLALEEIVRDEQW
jgi:nitroreductase